MKYDLNYLDENIIEEAEAQFKRVYPEFFSHAIGSSNDRKYVIIECEFPDGIFWFKVNENTVSRAYSSKDEAAR